MKKSEDRIPSREECYELMARHCMLQNIFNHSVQVMNVAEAIVDHLERGVSIRRDLVIAGSLLHDITKTQSLKTKEWHDVTGGKLLRDLGFLHLAEIVEQHVILRDFSLGGILEEREIVYYADKRVMSDTIVTVEERIEDLIKRYGKTEEIRNLIIQNKTQVYGVEKKIESFMKITINHVIQGLSK